MGGDPVGNENGVQGAEVQSAAAAPAPRMLLGYPCYPMCLILAGFGGFIASIMDFTYKGDESLILRTNAFFSGGKAAVGLPLYSTLLVILVAVAIAFIEHISSPRSAFFTGAGVISVVLTFVPPQTSLSGAIDIPGGAGVYAVSTGFGLMASAHAAGGPQLPVEFEFTSGGSPVNVAAKVTLIDEANDSVVGTDRANGKNFTLKAAPGDYILRVKAEGFEPLDVGFKAEEGYENKFKVSLTRSGGYGFLKNFVVPKEINLKSSNRLMTP